LLSRTPVGACLLRRLDAATVHPSEDSMAALRAAVTDLADRLRSMELPLEHVVGAVEALLRERHALRSVATMPDGDSPRSICDASPIEARVLAWCVRAYNDDAWW
jgi:hypothetical protein